MQLKTVIALMLVAVMFLTHSFSVDAYELVQSDATVESYYLYNFENDLVMADYNTDAPISASSTVKMMTACVALESGIDRAKVISITSEMLDGVTGRNMKLSAGDKLTFNDLLYATVIGGYNDASHALAIAVSGSLSDFIDLMNKKADSLSMNSTTYFDVSGMKNTGDNTTLKDIVILTDYLSKNSEYVEISATKTYSLSSSATCDFTTITNRASSMIMIYDGLSNFNTGSGDDGNCSVFYYNYDGLSFICIVMNAKATNNADNTNYSELYAKRLFAHALFDYSYETVLTVKNVIDTVPVKYSVMTDEVDIYLQDDLKLYYAKDSTPEEAFSYSVSIYGEELKAPLKAGDIVGELIVSNEGKIMAVVPLIVKEDVEKNAFLYVLETLKDFVLSRDFWVFVIIFAILMIAHYLLTKRHINKMHKKSKRKK